MRSALALASALLGATPALAIPPPAPVDHLWSLDEARAQGVQVEIEPSSPHCFAGTAVRVQALEHWRRKPIRSVRVEEGEAPRETVAQLFAERTPGGRQLRFCVNEFDRQRAGKTVVLILGYSGASVDAQHEFLHIRIPIALRSF